jgi:acetyl esterase/lipase
MRMLLSIALAVLGCGAPEARTDVSYDDRFGESTTMDVYLPDDDGAAHPAILLVHGGSWQFGSR